jgi:hypothetical protein
MQISSAGSIACQKVAAGQYFSQYVGAEKSFELLF